jgi:hypothetical protein
LDGFGQRFADIADEEGVGTMSEARARRLLDVPARSRLGLTLVVAVLGSACGDDSTTASGTGTGSTSSASTESTSTDTSSSSTTGSTTETTGCWREIDGDLIVNADSVVDELRDVKSVRGEVTINMGDLAQEDLSFLECLESADTLALGWNTHLRTTAGMMRLGALKSIRGPAQGAPLVLEGFDGLTELEWIEIDAGHTIEHIELPTIRSVKHFSIGGCEWGRGASPPQPPGPLTSLGNFESLESLEDLSIYGQPSLVDVSILDALIANGASPPAGASFGGNVSLPHDEIVTKLEALGVADYYLCGNLGDAEPCDCPPT